MKITVDTNFFISATQWDYSLCQKLLIVFLEKEVSIYTTNAILDEFSNVLKRDFGYSPEEVHVIVQKVLLFVHVIETTSRLHIVKEDPDDNKIVECAVDSNSEYIITYDKHLLKLREYNGIRIITPEQMMYLLGKQV